MTIGEAGYFGTDFLRPGSLAVAYPPRIREMIDALRQMLGSQLGDPAKVAAAFVAIAADVEAGRELALSTEKG